MPDLPDNPIPATATPAVPIILFLMNSLLFVIPWIITIGKVTNFYVVLGA
jgi:hypothetical protein